MLLVLEIILTVVAWRRGWKGWALVPLAVAFLLGLVLGGTIEASGGDVSQIAGVATPLEILCCLVPLIVMVSRPRKANHGVKIVDERASIQT